MSALGDTLTRLLDAQLTIGGQHILWREIVGNGFGLASAVGGMRRRVWAWPVGIVGNVLLFTVFLGAAFNTPQGANLLGQAGRQVMFVLVSAYGWIRWTRNRQAGGGTVQPRWATWPERLSLLAVGVVGVAALTPAFRALGSFEPVWADAWIFTGSLLATYAMARGWVDFWLVWIGVDVVGVPLLLRAHLYPSAVLYLVYGAFVIWGFFVWLTVSRTVQSPRDPSFEEVG
ncbi:MAG: nicotinamide riboside transporter PnuC [Kineosporiaceae bacterium]